jgi:hypothetical protein
MSRTVALHLQIALACCIGLLQLGMASGQTVILKDDFQLGTPDTAIPAAGTTPWRVNDILPSMYRASGGVGTPFAPTGNIYADLDDIGTGVAPNSQAVRLLSSNAADSSGYSPSITDKVTTFSFDFWEPLPDVDSPGQPGLGFGYYTLGLNDLNAAARNFRSFLHNGLLSPDAPIAGAAVAYDREKVHTVFMIANDTDFTTITGYRDGHDLAPLSADVWVSLDGADPSYAFSVVKQNSAAVIGGVGFRSFNPDVEHFFLDNVLLVDGASFDRSTFDTPAGQAGDYNGDEVVDAADYTVWRDHVGDTFDLPNRNPANTGVISTADYTWWKSHYGTPGSGGLSATTSAVPEPTSALLLLAGMFLFPNRLIRWAPANQLLAPTI